jgi:hypothetical protein
MTQEKANEIFNTDLGRQLNEIYVTSDDRAFVRNEEAEKHANGELDPDTNPLVDKTITDWYPEDGDTLAEQPMAVTQEEIKRMDIKEFRELGYLQEINRRFLHPLGLALEIMQNDDGTETLHGIWDYRNDPEGIYYDIKGSDQPRKNVFASHANFVEGEMKRRLEQREKILGFGIEPIPERMIPISKQPLMQ